MTPSGEAVESAPVEVQSDATLGVYVYGIVRAGDTGQFRAVGVGDSAIDFVEHAELAAAVSPIAIDRRLGRRADLVAHSSVLDALAAQGPVIPVRFGSVMVSEAGVIQGLLAPNAERFEEILADVADKAQFNVRARYDEGAVLAEIVATNPEIAELRHRTRDEPEDRFYAERVRLGELVARALDVKRSYDGQVLLDVLAPHTAAYNVREGAGLDHLIDVAFLVEDARRAEFEAAAEELASVMGERARLRLLGPLAPYDFVTEE